MTLRDLKKSKLRQWDRYLVPQNVSGLMKESEVPWLWRPQSKERQNVPIVAEVFIAKPDAF